jgi:hypothetical protein
MVIRLWERDGASIKPTIRNQASAVESIFDAGWRIQRGLS